MYFNNANGNMYSRGHVTASMIAKLYSLHIASGITFISFDLSLSSLVDGHVRASSSLSADV